MCAHAHAHACAPMHPAGEACMQAAADETRMQASAEPRVGRDACLRRGCVHACACMHACSHACACGMGVHVHACVHVPAGMGVGVRVRMCACACWHGCGCARTHVCMCLLARCRVQGPGRRRSPGAASEPWRQTAAASPRRARAPQQRPSFGRSDDAPK